MLIQRYLQPPLVAFLLLGAAIASDPLVPPGLREITPRSPLAGWIIVVLALGFGVRARIEFRRHNTTLFVGSRSTTLATQGPFRISRNPMYLAIVVAAFGVAIAFGKPMLYLVAPAFFLVITYAYIIPIEERALRETFGDSYTEYCSRVRRWL